MKSWAFGAMVVSMFAVATGCGSKGTGTTSGDTGGAGGTGSGGSTTGMMTTTGSNTTGTMTTTGSNTTATTTTGSSTTGTTTTGGGDTCADASDCTTCVAPSATDNTCGKCCDTATPGGYAAFSNALQTSCACEAASPCYAACGMNGAAPDFCADMTKMASQACVKCINGIMQGNACLTTFQTKCKADPDCLGFVGCLQGCAG